MIRNYLILVLVSLVLFTCELPSRENPWDEKAALDAKAWSAEGLQVEDVDITSKKVSWTYKGDIRIEGFQIDRKEGSGEWQESFHIADQDVREWMDSTILPDTTLSYSYRLMAIAGKNRSKENTVIATVKFPGPKALNVEVSFDSLVSISWNYEALGHEGFKIDRRKNSEAWQEAYGAVSHTQTSFSDKGVKLSLGHDYYYRVYAYYKAFNSSMVSDSLLFPELTTLAVSSVNTTTAASGGTIVKGSDIIERGVVWSTSQNPTLSLSTKTTDGTGVGSFTSSITDLLPGTTYYLRAYATNALGTAYGDLHTFITPTISAPSITTISVSNITSSSASSGGTIDSDGGAAVTSRGVVWSTSQNPTVSLNTKTTDGSGVGSFASSITGLQPGTTYYVRAYATNSVGTAYGSQLSFTTSTVPAVSTVTSPTGKVWMDRNLGASRVAISSTDAESYGDLYQWGRGTDGHEKRNSPTISTLSNSDTPGHGNFITVSSGNYDWRSPQNDNLWQGVNGINNPCPNGFRIPTIAEWQAELNSWGIKNSAGAFTSPLKLPVAGYRRYNSNGSLSSVGSYGLYWSSSVNGTYAQYLVFGSSDAYTGSNYRAHGYSVRCLKDN